MVKINYSKTDEHFFELSFGDTFLYNGVLGIVVEASCDDCGLDSRRAIELETGIDMELNDDAFVKKLTAQKFFGIPR